MEKITTICIATCDRPEQLRASLSQLIKHLEKYERSPRILLVDDSEDPESAQNSREILESYSLVYSGVLEFIDRTDRKNMALKMAKEKNISEEVMNFALCGDKLSTTTVGSVRNTCLLKTRGEKILMIDDDVVFDFFSPIEKQTPFFTLENPNEYWFLQENELPPRTLFENVEIDLLSAHEVLLGKKVSEILGDNTPEDMQDMEIIDTYMGAYGDSPMESHVPLLLHPDVQDKLKGVSLEDYQKIKNTRRIIKTPPSNSVYQGFLCIGMVMGIDNRGCIPPVFSNGRGEDFTFGAMRYMAFPLKVSGYIPLMIGHERPTKETRPPSYNSYYVTNMHKQIVSLILEAENECLDPLKNLQKISGKFVDLAKEPPSIFALRMEAQCEKNTREIIDYTNYLLQNGHDLPLFLVNDLQSLIATLSSPDPKLFLADITKNPIEDKMKILQKWTGLYGQLLKEWPKVIQ